MREIANERTKLRRITLRAAMLTLAVGAVVIAQADTVGSPAGASTARSTSAAAIAAVATRYIEQQSGPGRQLRATVNRLDPRWSAAACDGELTAFLPPGGRLGARTTVGVRCGSLTAWTFYMSVDVESELEVLVTREALPRGALLSAANLAREPRRVRGLGDEYVRELPAVAGLALRRPLPAGEPVPLAAVTQSAAVTRGQTVTLVAAVGSAQVRAQGIAMADARVGQRLRAQNPSSGRVVEGVVASDGSVALSP